MTVAEMRRRMSGREFVGWVAFFEEKTKRGAAAANQTRAPAERDGPAARYRGRRADNVG